MPSQGLQKTDEKPGAFARDPHPHSAQWLTSRRAVAREEFDRLISALVGQLFDPSAGSTEEGLEPALETLGLGMEAERVNFYGAADSAANESAFECRATWQRARPFAGTKGGGGDASVPRIDLSDWVGRGESLRRGLPLRAPRGLGVGREGERPQTGWQSWARETVYLPCVSPDAGLLGFFAVDGGESSVDWDEECLDRGLRVAGLVLNRLERDRLEHQAQAQRECSERGERLEALGRVASGVAHDFNNILTAILGYTEMLEMDADGEPVPELEEIRAAAHRATGLVQEVLDFSRLPERKASALGLGDTIENLQGMLARVVGEEVQLSLDLDPCCRAGRDRVAIDRGRFERLILNLASNARAALDDTTDERAKHFDIALHVAEIDESGADPDVPEGATVEPVAPGRYARLSIHDNGVGIDRAVIERVCEPYFTTKGSSGTGLGLSTMRDVLRGAAGGLRIESQRGAGATFHLYFPISGPISD